MEATLQPGAAAPPLAGIGSLIAARWRLLSRKFAERPPATPPGPPPEWFRYPLP